MDIKFVARKDINLSQKSSSKYKPLIDALPKLKPGGKALQVSFGDEAELSSMRNAVYSYNRETETNIKSSRDPERNIVYFYKVEERV